MHLHRLRRRATLCLTTALGVALSTLLAAPLAAPTQAAPATARAVEAETPETVVDPGYDGPTTSVRGLRADGSRAAAYPLETTFALHSAPGARRTLYLDFDGTGSLGSSWRVGGAQPGWSLDADPAFSDAERGAVQDVWQMVAEDYAPFDVDVTTEDPGAAAITRAGLADQVYGTRVLLSGSRTARSTADTTLCGGGCGGVAFVGVFDTATDHASYQPALVFPENLQDDSKAMADAASHEAGHTFGLGHDGTVAHDGVAAADYLPGQGLWGAIMGSPYSAPLTQWSRGDYAWASQKEDDLAVIAANGAPLRADLVGATVGTAAPLPAATGTPAGTGTIESAADVDVFGLGSCSGPVGVRADPAAVVGPDLDLSLTLLDRAGRVLASADPAAAQSSRGLATGLGASLSYVAAPGTALYAAVDGVGTSRYPDYGSLSRYLLTATGCVPAGNAPGPPRSLTATAGEPSGTLSVTWAAPATGPVSGYSVSLSPGGVVRSEPGTSTGTVVTGLRPGTTYTVSVLARDSSGTTSSPAVTTVLVPAVPPGQVASLDVSATADGRAVLTWTAPVDDGGAGVSGYLVQLGSLSQVFDPDVRGVNVSGLVPGATYAAAVSASNAAGTGPARSQGFTVPGSAGPAGAVTPSPGSASGPTATRGTAVLSPLVEPARRGAPKVGARLSVRSGSWPAPVSVRYRWLLDGRPVRVTRSAVRPPAAWAGRRVGVRLSVSAPGWAPVTRTLSWGRLRR